MKLLLLCCLRVILPNGEVIQAEQVTIFPNTQTVVIHEAPVFNDSFE